MDNEDFKIYDLKITLKIEEERYAQVLGSQAFAMRMAKVISNDYLIKNVTVTFEGKGIITFEDGDIKVY